MINISSLGCSDWKGRYIEQNPGYTVLREFMNKPMTLYWACSAQTDRNTCPLYPFACIYKSTSNGSVTIIRIPTLVEAISLRIGFRQPPRARRKQRISVMHTARYVIKHYRFWRWFKMVQPGRSYIDLGRTLRTTSFFRFAELSWSSLTRSKSPILMAYYT